MGIVGDYVGRIATEQCNASAAMPLRYKPLLTDVRKATITRPVE
jgi:hypothetical protein